LKIEIRPVGPDEHERAWEVLKELRTALSRKQFEAALDIQSREHGYLLVGAFSNGDLVGVMGMRPVHTFARGAHLHVDDLVVTGSARGRGIGRRLLEHAESHAREHGLAQVFLDSRPEVIGFYEGDGYRRHTSILVKKRLD
jgi:GNAT superfamily N-acetyltransferase